MVTPLHLCAACGSEHIRRNGSAAGRAKYQCKTCGHQARFVPAAVARAVRYAQVEKLLGERNSQRSIVRVTGVARLTVAGRPADAFQARFPTGGGPVAWMRVRGARGRQHLPRPLTLAVAAGAQARCGE